MKAMQHNLNVWLQEEAHVVAGRPFMMGNRSCIPVAQENYPDETPLGFLTTQGRDISFIAVQSEAGKEMMHEWEKLHTVEPAAKTEALPSEYWYG